MISKWIMDDRKGVEPNEEAEDVQRDFGRVQFI